MIIIIEGPKCSGKSPLANKLAEELGGTVIHFPTDQSITAKLVGNLTNEQYENIQDFI